MIKITCPSCSKAFNVNPKRMGEFKLKCQACSKPFRLFLEKDKPPVTQKLVLKKASSESVKTNRNEPSPPPAKESATADPMATAADVAHVDNPDDTRVPTDTDANDQTRPTSAINASNESDTSFEMNPSASETGTVVSGQAPNLQGYEVVNELGRGGLGVVYLANQVSLNRPVALKVIRDRIAKYPSAISRFIREAYAAAQLTHHNIVQIYDLGQEAGVHFFSMEFVRGQNLAEFVKSKGKLSPKQAAGFILQAARGLQFAHQQGMVHRDVKPANLLVNQQGVVKVADLGLVKVPDAQEDLEPDLPGKKNSQITMVGSTVGTANYLPPEQAENASDVDHRADIYSLGCSFHTLLTGSPPFRGKTVDEVISKHKMEKVQPLDAQVDGVDERLSKIVLQMLEKNPDQRQSSLHEVIVQLEAFLGLEGNEAFSPDAEHEQVISAQSKAFYKKPIAALRNAWPVCLAVATAVFCAIGWFVGWKWAIGMTSVPLTAIGSALVFADMNQRSVLAERIRQWLSFVNWKQWITSGLVAVICVVLAFISGLWLPGLIGVAVGVGLGAAFHFLIVMGLSRSREESVDQLRKVIREQRIAGVNENAIQNYIADINGKDWEELFEELFGYDQMRIVRNRLAAQAGPKRRKFNSIRDHFVDRFDSRLAAFNKEKDIQQLQEIEKAALVAVA